MVLRYRCLALRSHNMRLLFRMCILVFCSIDGLFCDAGFQHLLEVTNSVLKGNAALLEMCRGRMERGFSPRRVLFCVLSRFYEKPAIEGLLSEGDSRVLETRFWTRCKKSRGTWSRHVKALFGKSRFEFFHLTCLIACLALWWWWVGLWHEVLSVLLIIWIVLVIFLYVEPALLLWCRVLAFAFQWILEVVVLLHMRW